MQISDAGNNLAFNLSDEKQHPSASLAAALHKQHITPGGSTINLATKKFIVPFQGGFDGYNPSRFVALDTNISAANSCKDLTYQQQRKTGLKHIKEPLTQ